MKYPKKFKDLIEGFESFPGIGPKTAERLAFYAISKQSKDASLRFADSLKDAISSICECEICGMIADESKCEICKDDTRDAKLMIVENSKDVISFEKTNAYKGKYHVLNGLISPTNGIGPDDINLDKLVSRVLSDGVKEVILALKPSIEGETTSLYISKMLSGKGVKVSKIAQGIPMGADMEYIDILTLEMALEDRKEISN